MNVVNGEICFICCLFYPGNSQLLLGKMGIFYNPMADYIGLLNSTNVIPLSSPWFGGIAHQLTALVYRHTHNSFNDFTSYTNRKPKNNGLFDMFMNYFSTYVYKNMYQNLLEIQTSISQKKKTCLNPCHFLYRKMQLIKQ